MKKRTLPLIILISLILLQSQATSSEDHSIENLQNAIPGEIIAITCSNSHPTLGHPMYFLIIIQGKAEKRFNETITIIDEWSGFIMTAGAMQWVSSTITINQMNITLSYFPAYIKKTVWYYPSVVGNHTFHVIAGNDSEKHLNVSIGFDVEGIITPSLGCPAIIRKNTTNRLTVTLSEEREIFEEPLQISRLELKAMNGSSYSFHNHTTDWYTWIEIGLNTVEDEMIVSSDINSIPAGLYNLTITTTTQNYSWPHAVQIINTEPNEFTFVQLSDIHIGKYPQFIDEKQELIRLFHYINNNIHPNFVVLSGDSIDWYNQRSKPNVYADLREALLTSQSPVYIIPGNHERYSNGLFSLYFPYTNLTPYYRFLNPLSDYSLHYGNVNFIFLDSGYDYSRWEIQPKLWKIAPEGSGLTNTQMSILESTWEEDQMNQIIIMHHPAVSNTNDTGLGALPNILPSGNNECIGQNRGTFITYCLENNISLVLTGHTHQNHMFTSLGKETTNPTVWPLFIQTRSATLSGQNNGGRLITIHNSTVMSYEYLPFF